MGCTELAANFFRATHLEVGKKVRATINDLGGTMPEALPAPDVSIKQIENTKKKLEKNNKQA